MSTVGARAGQHARATVRRQARRFLLVLAAVVVLTTATGAALGFTSRPFAAVAGLAIAIMVLADRRLSPVIARWDRGAVGEETVGRALAPLEREGWWVLHDVVIGARGNIDHVVVGHGGLFTIETKSHGGRIRASRVEERMLSQAYAGARVLERVTGERVTPLLVFSRAYLDPAVSRQRGVTVLPARMLAEHLRKRPQALSEGRAAALHERLSAAILRAGPRPPTGPEPAAGYDRAVPERLHFTDSDEANELIASDPMALLVGFVLDQQVTVQKAFAGPLVLRERLGALDAATLASADLEPVFRARPAIHRFPASMAKRVHDLAAHVRDRYDGDAARVWTEAADADALRANLAALPGFGEMKVKALASVLAKRFGVTAARELVPWHPTLGDVDSPQALADYQAAKRVHKAEWSKARSPS